jgi:hypothetical protein
MADTTCSNCAAKCLYNRKRKKYNRKSFNASVTSRAGDSTVAEVLADIFGEVEEIE